jgi:hypothetical protein
MRHKLRLIIPAVLLLSSTASAQRQRTELGLGLDWRRQVGTLGDSTNRRKGLAIRIQGNVPWRRYLGFRLEGSYVQVQYDRLDPAAMNGTTGISETNFEVGAALRAFIPVRETVRPYVLAGTILSVRASCDLTNAFASTGFIRCAPGEDFLIGWGAGGGVQFGNWLGVKWFTEARLLGNLTAAAGGNLLAVSIGAGM